MNKEFKLIEAIILELRDLVAGSGLEPLGDCEEEDDGGRFQIILHHDCPDHCHNLNNILIYLLNVLSKNSG